MGVKLYCYDFYFYAYVCREFRIILRGVGGTSDARKSYLIQMIYFYKKTNAEETIFHVIYCTQTKVMEMFL